MKNLKYIIVLLIVILFNLSGVYAKDLQKLKRDKSVKQRNVIFILTDDHRYDYMGFTGKVP